MKKKLEAVTSYTNLLFYIYYHMVENY